MVVMSEPSACAARQVHDLTAMPSTRTVHAPHWLVSQPILVPVRPATSRRKWTSRSRGSTSRASARPLTVIVTGSFMDPSTGWANESRALHPTTQACEVGTPALHPTAQACAAGTPALHPT